MLVGIRKWDVKVLSNNPPVLRITTHAWEQTSGVSNFVGAWAMGRSKQLQVWTTYLNNVANHWVNTAGASSSGVVVNKPLDIAGKNPWRAGLPPDLQ